MRDVKGKLAISVDCAELQNIWEEIEDKHVELTCVLGLKNCVTVNWEWVAGSTVAYNGSIRIMARAVKLWIQDTEADAGPKTPAYDASET